MKPQMRRVSNGLCGELRGKHSGRRNWWIRKIRFKIGTGVIIKDSSPGKRFRNKNFTGALKIVKVNISSQSKESWNLGIEAMELELEVELQWSELQDFAEVEGGGNQ
jgi:hypothetical protein